MSSMPRLSAVVRRRTRRIYIVVLFILGLETTIGVFVWKLEQWRRLVLIAIFPTLLLAMLIGLILAGERWKVVGDFRNRYPSIATALILGIASASVAGLLIGPFGVIIGPIVLGFAVLVGWTVQKVRGFLGT